MGGSVTGETVAAAATYGGAHECTEALVAAGMSPDLAAALAVVASVVFRLALEEWRDWRRVRKGRAEGGDQ